MCYLIFFSIFLHFTSFSSRSFILRSFIILLPLLSRVPLYFHILLFLTLSCSPPILLHILLTLIHTFLHASSYTSSHFFLLFPFKLSSTLHAPRYPSLSPTFLHMLPHTSPRSFVSSFPLLHAPWDTRSINLRSVMSNIQRERLERLI